MARVELKRYIEKRDDNWSLLVVVVHIAFVFTPVYLTVVLGFGWQLVALWLWFGLAMNGLLNLMHEASHYHVFRARRGSDILGRWILGPMAMAVGSLMETDAAGMPSGEKPAKVRWPLLT